MYQIVATKRFKRQLKKLVRSNNKLARQLLSVVDQIAAGRTLDALYRDHQLKGKLYLFRECHIEPDWLLVYRIDNEVFVLQLVATGSHSNLFQ